MKFDKTHKVLIVLFLIAFAGCNSKSQLKSIDSSLTKNNDTTKSDKIRDSVTHAKGSTDSGSVFPPTQAEERERLSKTYDDIKIIDSTIICDNDTLRFHLKYYCLKNINLVEPKRYAPDLENKMDFVTHPFVSDIVLMNNRDTVLNRQFKASDFNPFFEDNFAGGLKKYGSILMPKFARKNKDKSRIVLDYPIAIPATDIGIGLFLIISKKGDYKIVKNY